MFRRQRQRGTSRRVMCSELSGGTSLHPSRHWLSSSPHPLNYQNCFLPMLSSCLCHVLPPLLPPVQSPKNNQGELDKHGFSGLESRAQECCSCSDLELRNGYLGFWSLLRLSTTLAASLVTSWSLLPAGCWKNRPGLPDWAGVYGWSPILITRSAF